MSARRGRRRSTCSRRRWTGAGRSPTTIAVRPPRCRVCRRRPSTASRPSTTTSPSRAASATSPSAPAPPAGPRTSASTWRRSESGSASGSASAPSDGEVSLGQTVCLGFCHTAAAVRDGDVVDAGAGVVERVRAGRVRGGGSPAGGSVLDEPVLLARGTFAGLRHALATGARELLEEVKEANVRGRGGAGFPAGTKWEFAARARDPDRVIVVNGDEGDPGSYIDKLLMERNPELLLEGMALAAYAVGARQGFVLVRSEYPRSMPILREAVERARAEGHLGEDIHGSGFAFDVEIEEGAGSYVVGEETALLASLQGFRGTVSARPPFPAERGWHGKPTVVHNVETLCNIPFIARHGARPTRRSARAPRPAPSSSASTTASSVRACTRCASAPRWPRSATSWAAAWWTATRSRPCRSAGRSAASSRVEARHALRLRRARGRGLHGRPRRHPRLRRAHRRARAGAPPARVRRPRELRQVLPLPDRAAARVRDGRSPGDVDRATGSRRCSRRSSWARSAPTAAACPPRSAA